MCFECKTCRTAVAGFAKRKAAEAASATNGPLPASESTLYLEPTGFSPPAP